MFSRMTLKVEYFGCLVFKLVKVLYVRMERLWRDSSSYNERKYFLFFFLFPRLLARFWRLMLFLFYIEGGAWFQGLVSRDSFWCTRGQLQLDEKDFAECTKGKPMSKMLLTYFLFCVLIHIQDIKHLMHFSSKWQDSITYWSQE